MICGPPKAWSASGCPHLTYPGLTPRLSRICGTAGQELDCEFLAARGGIFDAGLLDQVFGTDRTAIGDEDAFAGAEQDLETKWREAQINKPRVVVQW